jgi:hypothetical protein
MYRYRNSTTPVSGQPYGTGIGGQDNGAGAGYTGIVQMFWARRHFQFSLVHRVAWISFHILPPFMQGATGKRPECPIPSLSLAFLLSSAQISDYR